MSWKRVCFLWQDRTGTVIVTRAKTCNALSHVSKCTVAYCHPLVVVAQLCSTLCDPMDCSRPGFPVLHYLLEFAHTHIHWVDDIIQPSHPLSHILSLTIICRTLFHVSVQERKNERKLSNDMISVKMSAVLSHFSHVWLFVTPWTIADQTLLSVGFSRQEYWNGLPFPSPGDLPDRGIKPTSPALAGGFFTTEPPGKPAMSAILSKWMSVYVHSFS